MNRLNDGIYFISNNHIRIVDGEKIDADNRGALREVRILREPNNLYVYDVSIHILDDSLSNWRDKIQMASKPMKIITEDENVTLLRGFGTDQFGNSFADYGIELNYDQDILTQITLKLFDRNIDIVYYKAVTFGSENQTKIKIAKALLNLLIENHEDGDSLIRESSLKEYLQLTNELTVTTEDITDSVNFLNQHCGYNIITEGWIKAGSFFSDQLESSYSTEAPINFLIGLIEVMK